MCQVYQEGVRRGRQGRGDKERKVMGQGVKRGEGRKARGEDREARVR